MTLVIDGVFFQLANTGIARLWRAVLPRLAARLDIPIVFLDRGGDPGELNGVEVVPFPTYKSKFNAHDSMLLERVCRHYDAKVFVSTYYTTPLTTPSLLVVYDMIPERLGFDLTARDWREKEIAISYARRHICISGNTRKDLLEFYPELDPSTSTFAYCGVDSNVFKPAEPKRISDFRQRFGLARPYFLSVGSRAQQIDYKNLSHLFDAVKTMRGVNFDVLCVGAQTGVETLTTDYGEDVRIVQATLDDETLAVAYSGAAALVYPSLYEGFGLPVVEAMSCGCPVITTLHGSLAEVAADAAIAISGKSTKETVEALRAVLDPSVRARLVSLGNLQATKFRWEGLVEGIDREIRLVAAESAAGTYRAFYEKWAKLRTLQGEVDALA